MLPREEPLRDPEATPADVAVLLRARTKDEHGNELGEWTDETRPTFDQVQEQVEIARSLIRLDVGPLPEPCAEGAEATVALLAAMLVEQSYFPEQVSAGNLSAYAQLAALYERARAGVVACVARYGADGDAYELWVGGDEGLLWPPDWFQRDLEDPVARLDWLRSRVGQARP